MRYAVYIRDVHGPVHENNAPHATNCTDGSPGAGNLTLLRMTEGALKLCKDVRADPTAKYFPQDSPGAHKCNAAQTVIVWDRAYSKCTGRKKNAACSDECLKIIENRIASTPVCTEGDDVFTLNEHKKSDLVTCLIARKEDLKSNKVLMAVVTASGEVVLATMPPSSPPGSPTTSAAAPTVGVVAAVISVAAVVVAAML